MTCSGLAAVEDLYVDSSLLTAATLAGTHHSQAAAVFFDQLLQPPVRLYFSHLVRYEFLRALERLATSRTLLAPEVRAVHALDEWDSAHVRQRWFEFGMQQLDEFVSSIGEVFELPIDQTLYRSALEIMSTYRLNSYDALHVATALRVGLVDFASCDRDFERVEAMRVYYVTNRSLGLSSAS